MNYIQMLRSYTRFLFYAATHSFYSGIGQTIVISFFIPHIQQQFQIENAAFGVFYSVATWCAALTLPIVGRKIDDVNLRSYSYAVGALLVVSLLVIGSAPHLTVLFIGLMGLRLSGQSLMGHISATTMARYFGRLRGKALGLTNLGHPLGEAFFPLLATQLIVLFGWRLSYITIAVLIAITFFPITSLLVKKGDPFLSPTAKRKDETKEKSTASFSRKEVLKSAFFYCAIPLGILPPFLATGFFINNANLATSKGWTMEWIATCILVFSGMRILGAFMVGPWIDKWGARLLYPFHLIPMAIGMLIIANQTHPLIGMLYFGLMGLSIGFEMNLKSALWAEVYGTKHLGGIRSMTLTIGICSTGISPVLFGWLIDRGVGFPWIFTASAILILGMSFVALLGPTPKKGQAD